MMNLTRLRVRAPAIPFIHRWDDADAFEDEEIMNAHTHKMRDKLHICVFYQAAN